ncbi:MAG: hypothetical protein EON59_00740 [Alphaproteobacteria bacterium]|nr:MAG: hypothetical protein EON59_00740 [Alphaproteobacteria bacterium]
MTPGTSELSGEVGHTPDLSKADEKNAALTLTLKADSGYRSTETHRISANQWTEILLVCADAERRAVMTAGPDLLSELRALVTAVRFADPPKLFNGVLCHEARVPTAFIEGAESAISRAAGQAVKS